jgi:hypothetical protein
MAANSGLDPNLNFVQAGISQPEWIQTVLDNSYNFNKVTAMANRIGQPKQADAFKFNVANVGNLSISSPVVSSPSLSGANIVVSITPGETRFRVKDNVMDSATGVQGKIIAVSGNQITIEPQNTAFNASVHFQSGTTASITGTLSGNGTSTGMQSLSLGAETDYGVIAKYRETSRLEIQDRQKTFIRYQGKYWYYAQQMSALNRLNKAEEMKIVFDERLLEQTSVVEGNYNKFGGVYWTARNNPSRSTYNLITSAPSFQDVRDTLYQFKLKRAAFGQELVMVDMYVGAQLLQVIQDHILTTTQYTGVNSTFSLDKQSGYNVWILPIDGVMCRIHQYPLFNDSAQWGTQPHPATGFERHQSFMMLIDFTPTPSYNGGEDMATIQWYKFANANPLTIRRIDGMDVFNESVTGNYTEFDDMSWQALALKGLYVVPEKVGFMELR